MSPALELEAVSYAHPGGGLALDGVSLRIDPGQLVVLAGDSGSGKSTLLHAACGLAPHTLGGTLAGHVRVFGRDTRREGPAALAAVCGTVLQDPETQVVLNSVRAELALPLELRGGDAVEVARGVEEVALALGIERLLDRATHELSGGELQRVALAAALAPGVGLLLLDEPTAQLDPVAGDELVWLLRRLNEEHGTAVVLAEHRLDRCLHHADRVIALRHGRLACDATPDEFLEWAADAEPGLLPPAARLFVGAGLRPLPVGVRDARRTLGNAGQSAEHRHDGNGDRSTTPARAPRWRRRGSAGNPPPAVAVRGLWREPAVGPAVLRGIDLELRAGERVALMGRNGAGKSTLLRVLAGLDSASRGRIATTGRVGLLTQRPRDYLLHDRVGDETSPEALELVGMADLADRHPLDLSGGQRQRLALGVVLGGGDRPALIALDEPTRGMDAAARRALLTQLDRLASEGTAVLVATHDVEFAAELAERVLLLADGRLIADGPAGSMLSGGWYFGTQTARIVGRPGILTPEQGAALLRDRDPIEAGA